MNDYFTPDGYLSAQKVRNELKNLKYEGKKLTEKQVGDIVEPFWFQDYYANFICIPEVFESLREFLKKNGPEVNRNDFYRYHFSKTIKDQELWSSLQLIAVEFETMQRNDINEDLLEKISFKNKIKNISLDWLIKNNFVWEKDGKTEWRHHTYTEFIASEFILKQKEPIKTVNDLAVLFVDDDKSYNIKPSWYGVIKFLLQSTLAHNVTDWLLGLIRENPLNLSEDLTNVISVFGPTDLSNDDKEQIFNVIYDTYQERILWFPVWARRGLANYFTPIQLKKFQKHLEITDDEVKTYVQRGNVVAVVGELIRTGIINESNQVNSWKDRFIQFALDDNENGVLQRHSLDALSQFKETNGKLILKLRKNLLSTDTLVRDAFIQYCSATAPNSKEAIDVFEDTYAGGMSRIYSRHGMYEISTVEGFNYLIQKLITNKSFLHEFIDSESIFDGEQKDPDAVFVEKIIKLARSNKRLTNQLFELLLVAIKDDHIYQIERSYFLRKISQYIFEDQKQAVYFIKTIVNVEAASWYHAHNFFDILPGVLTKKNWEGIFALLESSNIENVERRLETVSYSLRFRNESVGKELFKIIAKKRGYQIADSKDYEKEEKKRKDELYKEFKFKIEPEKGRFITDVFKYYLDNFELVEERWSDYERDRLLYLAYEDGICRLNPRDFRVNFEEKKQRGGRFSWSSQAAFYGEMIKVVEKLEPSLLEEPSVRQHIIDFTPYCYSNNYEIVHKLITSIEPSHISWLIELYKNEDDDRRYLVPESFVYFLEHLSKHNQDISNSIPALRSLIIDENISDWVIRSALELLGKIEVHNKSYMTFLEDVFNKSEHETVKEQANRQLIIHFEDKESIQWRFEKVKSRVAPFQREEGVHSVGELENELDSKSFISPLYEVKTEAVFQGFLDLFSFVVAKYQIDRNYSSYLEYVWSSIIRYIFHFDDKSFFKHHVLLERYVSELEISSKKKPYLEYVLQNIKIDFINKMAIKGVDS